MKTRTSRITVSLFIMMCVLIPTTLNINISFGSDDNDPFGENNPGQYVYYHDTRKNVYGNKNALNRLLGIMKIGYNKYLMRIYDIDESREGILIGSYIRNNNHYEFMPKQAKGDQYWLSLVTADLLNILNYYGNEYSNNQKNSQRKEITINSNWKNYGRELINRYCPWIPFYHLKSSVLSGTKECNIKCVFFGRMMPNDTIFFQITNIPNVDNDANANYRIEAKGAKSINLNGIVFKLDDNWKLMKGDVKTGVPHDTCWVSKYSARDSQIGVETIELHNKIKAGGENELLFLFMNTSKCIITDSVSINGKTISYIIQDVNTNTYNRQIFHIIKFSANEVKVINFSSFEVIYTSNKSYFDNIVTSYHAN
ncbi:MAG: hypothetical protein JXA20_02840 [Spirochaetes bacterium]|nr:hypothetical protein [Spirochaetota bacterium]